MITRITIRFTQEEKHIHDALKKSAEGNRRSLNAEMLRAIEFYLKEAPDTQYRVSSTAEKGKVTKKKSPQ